MKKPFTAYCLSMALLFTASAASAQIASYPMGMILANPTASARATTTQDYYWPMEIILGFSSLPQVPGATVGTSNYQGATTFPLTGVIPNF